MNKQLSFFLSILFIIASCSNNKRIRQTDAALEIDTDVFFLSLSGQWKEDRLDNKYSIYCGKLDRKQFIVSQWPIDPNLSNSDRKKEVERLFDIFIESEKRASKNTSQITPFSMSQKDGIIETGFALIHPEAGRIAMMKFISKDANTISIYEEFYGVDSKTDIQSLSSEFISITNTFRFK